MAIIEIGLTVSVTVNIVVWIYAFVIVIVSRIFSYLKSQ